MHIDPYSAFEFAIAMALNIAGWLLGYRCAVRRLAYKQSVAHSVGRKEGYIWGFEQGRIDGLKTAAQRTAHHVAVTFSEPAVKKLHRN